MRIKTDIKFYLLVVISIASFLPLAPVMASGMTASIPVPAPALSPPRSCVITGSGGKSLTIVAGPDFTSSDPTAQASEFPEAIPCPDDATKICAKWNYRFIWQGMNPSLSYVDLSSDQAVKSISTTGSLYGSLPDDDSDSGLKNYDVRWIKWTSNAATYQSSFITPIAKARSASAGGKSGTFKGFCLIQGAGQVTQAPQAFTAEKRTTTTDGKEICTIVDPTTQCEVGVDCQTHAILPSEPLSTVIGVEGDPATYVAIPGQQCPTFVTDNGGPNTTWYCSGGRCYIISP
jgi:hypothetical protein